MQYMFVRINICSIKTNVYEHIYVHIYVVNVGLYTYISSSCGICGSVHLVPPVLNARDGDRQQVPQRVPQAVCLIRSVYVYAVGAYT